MLFGLKLFIISWVWVHICAPVKFLTFFPTWASNRNLIFQAKLQNSLCSCTSWGYMCNTNEICDTYPESSWYKLLKNARKSWNNHKSFWTLLDKNTQKRILWFVRLKVLVWLMADMVEVYHETPWGCLLLGLVGHMGNFLDLEGLCGGFWLRAWWISGRLHCRPVITIKGICQQKSSHGAWVGCDDNHHQYNYLSLRRGPKY